ncbi:MAG: tRNA pseudouridine(38-40) synthase TruA [Anaerolineae bacterium]
MTSEYRCGAVVEYDGADFRGFQVQATGRTVQGELERALEWITHSKIRVDGAGRTDAGVHATGQVIAFKVIWKHSLEELHRALNANLPDDIVVRDLTVVNDNFHPRFSALSRSYSYTIISQLWPSVLQRRYVYHLKKKLDVVAMNEASKLLLGCHDFASFGKPPRGENTERCVTQAQWSLTDNIFTFHITANAFLYRMVRTIVGTVVQVGLAKLTLKQFKEIFEARDLSQAAPPAPAHGLCLVKVTYPVEYSVFKV